MAIEKSLTQILGGSILKSAVTYPIVSMLYTLNKSQSFTQGLSDSKVILMTLGIGAGYLTTGVAKEMYYRYKTRVVEKKESERTA